MINGNLKATYGADERVLNNRNKQMFVFGSIILLALFPLFADDYSRPYGLQDGHPFDRCGRRERFDGLHGPCFPWARRVRGHRGPTPLSFLAICSVACPLVSCRSL